MLIEIVVTGRAVHQEINIGLVHLNGAIHVLTSLLILTSIAFSKSLSA